MRLLSIGLFIAANQSSNLVFTGNTRKQRIFITLQEFFSVMEGFVHRKSNYEHYSLVTSNTMNTLMSTVSVFDYEATNWSYVKCEFHHTRSNCLAEYELG